MMAIAIGLIAGLFLLLGFHLLGAGLRNPRWLIVVFCLIFALYTYGKNQLALDTEFLTIQPLGAISGCPELNSLRVKMSNHDTRAVIGFSFSLYGVRPNYSDSVAQAFHRSDRIIPAGMEWTACWEIQRLEDIPAGWRSSLIWSAQFDRVDFGE